MRSPAEPPRLTAAVANARRRLVVWCPDWPVRAVASSGIPVGESTPVALVAAGVVHACSTAARAQGVRRGLRVREAQSRCPDLLTLAHDPELDARVFGPLVDLVADVVPHVHVPRPGTATVGVDGAVRVHGSEAAVGAILAERVVGHGVDDVRVGVADTVFAAEQAARRAPAQDTLVVPSETTAQFLAPLPIDVLDEPELAHLLRRLGLWTLGDLALLPEPAVRERFGALGVACHRRARGIEDRAFTPRAEPVPHEVSTFFDTPLRRAEHVVASCEEAAERFVADLAHLEQVCTAMWIEVAVEDGPPVEQRWAHPRFFEPRDVLDRLAWQLEEQPPGAPVVGVRFVPDEVVATSDVADGLWGDRDDHHVRRAAARIQGMLGHDAIGLPVLGGGRTPSERQRLLPWGDALPTAERPGPWPGRIPPPAPATVFTDPVPARVLDRGGRLVTVTDRGALSASPVSWEVDPHPLRPLQSWAGPWEVDERWWAPGEARRAARLQVVGVDGDAWLLVHDGGRWWGEARYD